VNFIFTHIFIFVFGFLLTFFFIKKFLKVSHKLKSYGEENTYVTRVEKVPTSGGIVIFFVFLLSFIFFYFLNADHIVENLPNRSYLLVISVFTLFTISVYDDFYTIHPFYKLILQIILAYISIVCINLNEINFPLKFIILLMVIFWVYIMNIINFIDGSDGFLSSYSLFFFSSIFFTELMTLDFNSITKLISFLVLPTLIVFLYFNKPMAKIFMGDSGSIFLGFLIGFTNLELIIQGHWKLSLILLMYPLLDCTITLLIKIKNGHYPWARLFDYFFLGPIKKDNNHKFVLKVISIYLLINFLIFIAQIKFQESYFFILISLILTIITLIIFKKKS